LTIGFEFLTLHLWLNTLTNPSHLEFDEHRTIFFLHKHLQFDVLEFSRLWRPFWHSKLTFFKNLWTKKSWEIKLSFISKNPFVIWSLQSKVIDKNQRGCLKISMKIFLATPLWILSKTFEWRLKITNGFLEMKLNFISQLFLVQRFLKKVVLLWQNGL
jgi:hypothetical protein